MALGRLKGVYRSVVNASANQNFLADQLRKKDLDEDSSKADAVDFLEFPTYTVSEGVDGSGDLQDGTVNQIGLTNTNIDIAEHPAIFVELGTKDQTQLATRGTDADGFGKKIMADLRNEIDTRLHRYARAAAYLTTGSDYHDNPGANQVTKKMVFDGAGRVENAGSDRMSLELWCNPMALGAFSDLESWSRGAGETAPAIGISKVGAIGDIPVLTSKIVPYRRTVAVTASAIDTGELTMTVASGHGIVAGMRISTTGLDAGNIAAPGEEVLETTATTIVVATDAGDDATNGDGTITIESAENLLIAKDLNHVALQLVPTLELVDGGRARVSKVLKCYALFGTRMRVGSVRVFHTAP